LDEIKKSTPHSKLIFQSYESTFNQSKNVINNLSKFLNDLMGDFINQNEIFQSQQISKESKETIILEKSHYLRLKNSFLQ
jgi:ABC-type dipeptide/oligopeptide/nickel transport system ATPase subunit